MIVGLGLVMNALLLAGAWRVAGRLVRGEGTITRVLACVVVAQTWMVVGMQLLGTAGGLSIGPLSLWSGLLFVMGLVAGRARPGDDDEAPAGSGLSEPWRIETVISVALVLWAAAYLGMQSLVLPVKVVSDGPIYHLYFAVRWWKAGRLFLVASPFGESAATYFPANGDLWFTWLTVSWGGDRLARVGQAPFLLVAGLAAYGLVRMLGSGRDAALLATCWFVTSMPFLLFSFEANVDTIFVAAYLSATYFFLLYGRGALGASALVLGGLAAGLALGTKSVGLVFVPFLLALAVGAIAARVQALGKTITASLLVAACVLIPSGFWFARNLYLTGNPLYPLHVELFGKAVLRGWYGREAMRSSPYYVPVEDWRALVDTLMAVIDPRMAPFWVASLAGAWAIGRRGRTGGGGDGWVWATAALAVLNVAFYWIFIPYRTQQRFMLQGLGLAVVPLARLFDRSRVLRAVAAIVLAVHVLTPQAWPVAAREADIPWDLSPLIPNAVSPILPVLSRAGGVFRAAPVSGPSPSAGLGLMLAMGGAAAAAAWGWSRSRAGEGWAPGAVALAGMACLLVFGAVDGRSFLADTRHAFYPPFRDYYGGWLDLEGRSGPSGARVAYAGTNIPYYLFGAGLRNDVRYVNIDAHRDWLMHDYHRAAADRGEPTWPNSRPGWDRIHPDFEGWLANLQAEGIQLLVVTRVNPAEGPHNVADAEGFPIERRWADTHPELFEPLYGPRQKDWLFRLYRFHPPGSDAGR
jgi:hypothetical protein